MIKKSVALTLLLCVVLTFCSCDTLLKDIIPDWVKDKDITDMTDEMGEGLTDESEYTEKIDTYKDIPCVESNGFAKKSFSPYNDNTVFRTLMPKDFVFSENADGDIDLSRGGNKIGQMSIEANTEISEDNCEFSEDYFYRKLTAVHSIHKLDAGEYVHYFKFDYVNDKNVGRTIYMTVNYAELDAFATTKILYNVAYEQAYLTPDMTSQKLSTDVINSGANIMILGNSFIGTSEIGSILSDMCGGEHFVDAISRGYATVTNTYSVDNEILNSLRLGEVDALFICGFYSSSDSDALLSIVNACRASGTKLFIFPAHNENRSAINSAVSKYDYPILLDWKGEIDLLIDSGVNYDDFCINDSHKHSKPLAGYVGAHMIYRTLFGKMPPDISSLYDIDQSYVNQKLGDYVDTGVIEVINERDIIRLN